MTTEQLCYTLAEISGTPGDEHKVAEFVRQKLEEYNFTTYIDPLGNVIGNNNGSGKKILLAAHTDQVGLVVRGIDNKGFLLFDKIGGIDLRVLTGSEVIVHGKEELFGVICSTPPHLLTEEEKKSGIDISKLAIDVGYNREQIKSLVSPGDRVTLKNIQLKLLNGNISSAAFDDRACIAVILAALEKVKDKIKSVNLSVLFSVQEEVGLVGAKTGAFSVMPDQAIVLDVGFGDDPYTDKSLTISMNKGPSIGISPVLDKGLCSELTQICKNTAIPYQHDVMNGRTGTDADSISINGCGVKTALISLPLRYMHTANEIINIADIESTAKLLSEFLLKKEAENNA